MDADLDLKVRKFKATQPHISDATKKTFSEYEDEGNITIGGINKILRVWKVQGGGVSAHEIMRIFSCSTDQWGRSTLDIVGFARLLGFFSAVKSAFSRYQQNNSVYTKALLSLLTTLGFDFPQDSLEMFITFFDVDQSGVLELNETFALTMFLYTAESVFLADPKIKVDGIQPEQLGAIMRAMAMPLANGELKSIARLVPANELRLESFRDLVSLIQKIRDLMPKIKEAGKLERKQKKVKKPMFNLFTKAQRIPKAIEKDEALTQAIELKNKVVAECKRTKSLWSDPDFPAEPSSLFPNEPHRNSQIDRWLRPAQLSNTPGLFVDGVEEGDVVQGGLADCYLLSALSVLATDNALIESIFVHKEPEIGFYQLRFFVDSKWVYVAIDDQLPCSQDGKLRFGRCQDSNEFWVQILEKAYAKLHGNYGAIESGLIGDALTDLIGAPHEVLTVVESKKLWKLLRKYCKRGYFMGCANENPEALDNPEGHNVPNEMGIFQNHAYGIIDVQQVHGNKLLRLRNPWGKEEWNGPFSDDAAEWTPDLLKHFNYAGENDGTFFMEFSDWCNEFNQCICAHVIENHWAVQKFTGRWQRPNFSGGCINQPSWPKYKLRSTMSTPVYVVVAHENNRIKTQASFSEYPAAGCTLLFRDQKDLYKQETIKDRDQVKGISKFVNIRDAIAIFKAQPNQNYTAVVSTFLPNVEGNFFLRFYSEYPLEVTPLTTVASSNSIRGEWQGLTAGGCPNHTSWHRCPQYILVVNAKMQANITIVQERKENVPLNHIGFHVFPANTERKSVVDPSLSMFHCKYTNSATVSGSVELNEGVYNLVATTFEPGFNGKFGMVVQPAGASLRPIENDWNIYTAAGKWSLPNLAGGPPTGAGQWMNNPRVWFQLQSPTIVTLVLTIQNPEIRGIGFVICASDPQYDRGTRIHVSPFKTDQEVILSVGSLAPGCYLVYPCTYQPSTKGDWELTSYSSAPLTLQSLDNSY